MDTAVQTHDPTPEPAPRAPGNAPQLRTLLLTDLVDSTGLVERLGDEPASELFRAHDRLVLQLQQQWRGRLIDRSDGLLLLFERPIDGLGFALDYVRGLIALGSERDLVLRARAGLHVGEVLTWRNSDEAVSIGAKPLEVEGLAKPIAARLMAMARPGQILLSAVAEPLAHRAARELGERGQHLAWKSWGRWRFKGVPEPQQIFEVGEPGVAPLRMPPNTPKAWRDIPLWRRPAALAAELALLAGGALGLWFITRPEPAIAFNQRDWVVVGDLRNLTGQSALDDSLEQAFRISLEQSRYVNVLSDLKARDTLQRMQRAQDTVLDRAVASEIALRDGARAVILPTVAEVGGRVRVSAEVIDPRTQTTVYAESAEGTGLGSALDSIDDVTAALRGKLGEAVKSIEKDSVPLPQVTTKNLDALRAYALGQKAYGRGEFREALGFYQQAYRLDPAFALAYVGAFRAHWSTSDVAGGMDLLRKAMQLRDRLPAREQFYLDGWDAQVNSQEAVLGKWRQMADLYPDFFPASANVAIALYERNRFADALPYARKATSPQNEFAALSWDLVGRNQLALERHADARKAFEKAIALGASSPRVRLANSFASQFRFADAAKAWPKEVEISGPYCDRATVYLDQGLWTLAETEAAQCEQSAPRGSPRSREALLSVATVAWVRGEDAMARSTLRDAAAQALDAIESGESMAAAVDDANEALAAILLAQRLGDRTLSASVQARLAKQSDLLRVPSVAGLLAVVQANDLRLASRPGDAVTMLRGTLTGAEPFQAHHALMEAAAAAGDTATALAQAQWLSAHRGRAYSEVACVWCLQPLNVHDTVLARLRAAEILAAAGKPAAAREQLGWFDRQWPTASLPDRLRQRRDRVAVPASN